MNADQRWKLAVLESDNWTCRVPDCGANTCLDAAHIQPKSRRPDLRHDPAKEHGEIPLANTDVHLIYKEIMDQAGSRIYRPQQIYVGHRKQHYVPIEKRNKAS